MDENGVMQLEDAQYLALQLKAHGTVVFSFQAEKNIYTIWISGHFKQVGRIIDGNWNSKQWLVSVKGKGACYFDWTDTVYPERVEQGMSITVSVDADSIAQLVTAVGRAFEGVCGKEGSGTGK